VLAVYVISNSLRALDQKVQLSASETKVHLPGERRHRKVDFASQVDMMKPPMLIFEDCPHGF